MQCVILKCSQPCARQRRPHWKANFDTVTAAVGKMSRMDIPDFSREASTLPISIAHGFLKHAHDAAHCPVNL